MMIKSDLISRSDLLKEIEKSMNNNMHKSPKTRYSHRMEHMHFSHMVSKVPGAYDVEAVCEEIKDVGTRFCESVSCNEECSDCDHGLLMKTLVDIVRNGGKKDNVI